MGLECRDLVQINHDVFSRARRVCREFPRAQQRRHGGKHVLVRAAEAVIALAEQACTSARQAPMSGQDAGISY